MWNTRMDNRLSANIYIRDIFPKHIWLYKKPQNPFSKFLTVTVSLRIPYHYTSSENVPTNLAHCSPPLLRNTLYNTHTHNFPLGRLQTRVKSPIALERSLEGVYDDDRKGDSRARRKRDRWPARCCCCCNARVYSREKFQRIEKTGTGLFNARGEKERERDDIPIGKAGHSRRCVVRLTLFASV